MLPIFKNDDKENIYKYTYVLQVSLKQIIVHPFLSKLASKFPNRARQNGNPLNILLSSFYPTMSVIECVLRGFQPMPVHCLIFLSLEVADTLLRCQRLWQFRFLSLFGAIMLRLE